MKSEISAAVVFLTRLVKKNENLSEEQVGDFSKRLEGLLGDKFKNHWYLDDPQKGQAYRCIRMNETSIRDPVIEQAAIDTGLVYADLKLPTELTLWVDPKEVCCRFGENKGSWCTLFKEGKGDHFGDGPVVEKVLSQSQKHNTNKPFEATRINNRSNSSSPPMVHQYYRGGPPPPHHMNSNNSNMNRGSMNNYHNHNHNNNTNKFRGPPPPIGPNGKFLRQGPPPPPPPPPPPMQRGGQGSPTFMRNKMQGSPLKPYKMPPPPAAQFQQRVGTSRNDRFHWVRGADLVKA